MIRVIQWASGAMGRTALRRIIDHPDLELVGLYVYDPGKVGLDAGEIARRSATGVRATQDIETLLALPADVVLHTPRISLPYAAQNDAVQRLLASGKNVISLAGFHHPMAHGAPYAAGLLAACQAGRSTLAGMGLNPGFMGERLVPLLSGLCARLQSLHCREVAEVSTMPAPGFVFDTLGFGSDPQGDDLTRGPLAALYGQLYLETLTHVAQALGTTVAQVRPAHRLTAAPHDISIAAGTVRAGRVAATEWCWHADFASGQSMTHSVLWTANARLHDKPPGAAHWEIELIGRPNLKLSLALSDPDPGAPHTRPASDATVAVAIRAIPDVCAAPPGFFRYPDLAPYRERF